jgi:hypothetical protein
MDILMSYKINHKKHILDYLQRYTTGTPKEIAAAFPKAKRKPTTYTMIAQALLKLYHMGKVKRVAPGVYASMLKDVSPVDTLCDRDDLARRILQVLEPKRGHMVPSSAIYAHTAALGIGIPATLVKLRKLKAQGIVGKQRSSWFITELAFANLEWLKGEGFAPAPPIQLDPIGKMPSRKGIAGEPVPAANILRKHALQRDRTPIVQPKPTQPEEFTVPTPGRESSIFD